jgi:N-acetylornithine carbamoyltransferase
MRHFLSTQDWTYQALEELLDRAAYFKRSPWGEELHRRTVLLLFFNSSLRTRSSFEIGVRQLGGQAVVMNPGRDAWPMEAGIGATMDGEAEEHVAEAARVLSRFGDLLGVRAFPKFKSWDDDREDPILNAFVRHATVPVMNLETIVHPCQELAHILTLREKLGNLKRRRYLLTWTYHPKPLNTAVANSALLIASRFGMDVTLLCPTPEYLLDERYMSAARKNAAESGGSITVTHDIEEGYRDAEVVYAKSWGALPYFGRWEEETQIRHRYKHFMVDERKMALTDKALFSHCLPLRRNVKATDGVMEAPYCVAIDEAENRLHVQKAVMAALMAP